MTACLASCGTFYFLYTVDVTILCEAGQEPVLNSFQDVLVLDDFQVLRFIEEKLVWVFRLSHRVLSHLGLSHLLRDLASSCDRVSSCSTRGVRRWGSRADSPLLLPRMKLYTG